MIINVVIAAYDEEDNIEALTKRLVHTLETLNCKWKIIYVIEGRDRTAERAAQSGAEQSQLTILYGPERTGLGSAFRRGFAAVAVETDFVITMDADLNHQPEEIAELLDVAKCKRADIVIGSRRLRGSSINGLPYLKRIASELVNHAIRLIWGVKISDITSGFRIYRAAVLRNVSFRNNEFAFLPEILIRAHQAGAHIVEQPIRFLSRSAGRSKMTLGRTLCSYVELFARGICQRMLIGISSRRQKARRSSLSAN